ncbi:MAG: hypothetical protein U0Q18_36590 [Bryobacteraceae bacterium]
MNATTMDAAAHTRAPATEISKPVVRRLLEPVTEVLGGVFEVVRWIWCLDVGTVVLIGEQSVRFVKAAVKRGEEVEPTLAKPFKRAQGTVSGALGEAGTRLKGIAKPLGPKHARRKTARPVHQSRSEKGR